MEENAKLTCKWQPKNSENLSGPVTYGCSTIWHLICANLCCFKKTSDLNDLLGVLTYINYVQAFLAHMWKQSTMGWDHFWGDIDTLIKHWKTSRKMFVSFDGTSPSEIVKFTYHDTFFSIPLFWAKNKNTMLLKKDLHTIITYAFTAFAASLQWTRISFGKTSGRTTIVKTIGKLWLDLNCKSFWKERPTNILKAE